MPTFRYEAMTSTGEEIVDVIEADDAKTARKRLAARGLFVTKLSKSAADSPDGGESEPANGPTFYVTKNPWAHGLMCFLGLAFTTIGVGSLSWASHWREHGERTVVVIVKTQTSEGAYRYQAGGRTIEKPIYRGGGRESSEFSRHAWGRRLDALYDPKDPEHVVLISRVDSFRLAGLIFLPGGIVCLLAGLAGFAVILRQTSQTRNS